MRRVSRFSSVAQPCPQEPRFFPSFPYNILSTLVSHPQTYCLIVASGCCSSKHPWQEGRGKAYFLFSGDKSSRKFPRSPLTDFLLRLIGQNSVTWPLLAARETGKASSIFRLSSQREARKKRLKIARD